MFGTQLEVLVAATERGEIFNVGKTDFERDYINHVQMQLTPELLAFAEKMAHAPEAMREKYAAAAGRSIAAMMVEIMRCVSANAEETAIATQGAAQAAAKQAARLRRDGHKPN